MLRGWWFIHPLLFCFQRIAFFIQKIFWKLLSMAIIYIITLLTTLFHPDLVHVTFILKLPLILKYHPIKYSSYQIQLRLFPHQQLHHLLLVQTQVLKSMLQEYFYSRNISLVVSFLLKLSLKLLYLIHLIFVIFIPPTRPISLKSLEPYFKSLS